MQAILTEKIFQKDKTFISDKLALIPLPQGSFEVKNLDAACLQKDKRLNDVIINEASSMLYQLHLNSPPPEVDPKVTVVLNSFFQLKIEEYANKPTDRVMLMKKLLRWQKKLTYPKSFLDYTTILCTINYINSHWLLVRIETSEKRMYLYDSICPAGTTDENRKRLDNFKNFFNDSEHANVTDSLEKPWTYHNACCPQQYDEDNSLLAGNDCGIFAIMCLSRILENKNIEFDQKYIYDNKIREKIFLNIYNRNFELHKL